MNPLHEFMLEFNPEEWSEGEEQQDQVVCARCGDPFQSQDVFMAFPVGLYVENIVGHGLRVVPAIEPTCESCIVRAVNNLDPCDPTDLTLDSVSGVDTVGRSTQIDMLDLPELREKGRGE